MADATAAPNSPSTAVSVVEAMQEQVGKSVTNVGSAVKTLGTDLKVGLAKLSNLNILGRIEEFSEKQNEGINRVALTLEKMMGQDEEAARREREMAAEKAKEKPGIGGAGDETDAEIKDQEEAASGFLAGMFGGLTNSSTSGTPVSLVYGMNRVGGQFLSGYISSISHGSSDTISVGAQFDGT